MASVAEGSEVTAGARNVSVLERCRVCTYALPVPPAPRICSHCGTAKLTPHHSDWNRALKTFLILQYAARHLFPEWRSVQDSWELLLSGHYQGKKVNGRIVRHSASPDEIYSIGVTEAEEWRTSGSPTAFL